MATEIDYAWTYVGGGRALIDGFLADPRLEALPAQLSDSPFFDGDAINAVLDVRAPVRAGTGSRSAFRCWAERRLADGSLETGGCRPAPQWAQGAGVDLAAGGDAHAYEHCPRGVVLGEAGLGARLGRLEAGDDLSLASGLALGRRFCTVGGAAGCSGALWPQATTRAARRTRYRIARIMYLPR